MPLCRRVDVTRGQWLGRTKGRDGGGCSVGSCQGRICLPTPVPPSSLQSGRRAQWVCLTLLCDLSLQQPNIKQKFVALLKRFKVSDEV